MDVMHRKRWLSGVLVTLLVLTAGLVGSAMPVAADGGGSLIVNTVYKTVTKRDINYIKNLSVPGLIGNPLTGVDLSNSAAITAALVAVGVDPTSVTINRDQTLQSTTTSHQTTVSVDESPGAVVIGDPSDLATDNSGQVIVVTGTVTVTDTETTINTQHILETVTITGSLASTPCTFLQIGRSHMPPLTAMVDTSCAGEGPVGFVQLTRSAPTIHDLHLTTLVASGRHAILYGWARISNGTTVDLEVDAEMGLPMGSVRLHLSTGYDSGTQHASVVLVQFTHQHGSW